MLLVLVVVVVEVPLDAVVCALLEEAWLAAWVLTERRATMAPTENFMVLQLTSAASWLLFVAHVDCETNKKCDW